MTKPVFHQPVIELPVRDVRTAQEHYRDIFGFEIAWYNEPGRLGAVSHSDSAVFFREVDGPIHPVTLWVYTEDPDGLHEHLKSAGATIIDPPETKPWGLRQFSVRDLNGHILHFHHDP